MTDNSTLLLVEKHPKPDELLENTLLKLNLNKDLTKRETEILNLILAGNTNKEISQKICRSERTIEYHRNRLMRKLGTRNAAELVKCALAMGIA
ncbi:MAG: helix-turn-helix transcriptional regulator [Phycisphaerae bacterium]|nr:helix-turn-helix transcriptional regulator [Phycisphaerae bacterium]